MSNLVPRLPPPAEIVHVYLIDPFTHCGIATSRIVLSVNGTKPTEGLCYNPSALGKDYIFFMRLPIISKVLSTLCLHPGLHT